MIGDESFEEHEVPGLTICPFTATLPGLSSAVDRGGMRWGCSALTRADCGHTVEVVGRLGFRRWSGLTCDWKVASSIPGSS
jgi:hypothetical protein